MFTKLLRSGDERWCDNCDDYRRFDEHGCCRRCGS